MKKLQLTDVRIGNAVSFIIGIYSTNAIVDTHNMLFIIKDQELDGNKCEPIPITGSILETLGFVECKAPYRDEKAYVIGEDANRIVWCCNELYKPLKDSFIKVTTIIDITDKPRCMYVHQLQNLLLDMQGRELPVTELITKTVYEVSQSHQ